MKLLRMSMVIALAATASVEEAMFEGVRADDVEAIRAAIEAGADMNARGVGGQTPLMHGALQGKIQAVSFLLDRGADPTIPEKDGYTLAHGAGFQGRAAMVQLLVSRGLPIDEPHADGYTPVQRACWGREKRHAKTVEAFLHAGAVLESAASCRTTNAHTKRVLATFGVAGAHLSPRRGPSGEERESDL